MPVESSASAEYFGKTFWIHDAGRDPVDYAYITVERVRRQGHYGVDHGEDDNDWGNEADGGDDDDDEWGYGDGDWNVDRPDERSTRSILPATTMSSRPRSETLPASTTTSHIQAVVNPRRVSNPPASLLQTTQSLRPSQSVQTRTISSPAPQSVPANPVSNESTTRIFSQTLLPSRVTLPLPHRNISTNTPNHQALHTQPRSMPDPPTYQESLQANPSSSISAPLRELCAKVAVKRNRGMVDDDEGGENEGNQAAPKRRRLMNFMDLVALSRAGALRHLGGVGGMAMRPIEGDGS